MSIDLGLGPMTPQTGHCARAASQAILKELLGKGLARRWGEGAPSPSRVSGCVASAGQALWGLACLRALPDTPRRCHHFGNLFRHLLYFSRGSYRKRTGGFTQSKEKEGWHGLMSAFFSTGMITLGTSNATLRCSRIQWSPASRLASLAGFKSQPAGGLESSSIKSSGTSIVKSHRSSNRRGVRMYVSVSRQASAAELEV